MEMKGQPGFLGPHCKGQAMRWVGRGWREEHQGARDEPSCLARETSRQARCSVKLVMLLHGTKRTHTAAAAVAAVGSAAAQEGVTHQQSLPVTKHAARCGAAPVTAFGRIVRHSACHPPGP